MKHKNTVLIAEDDYASSELLKNKLEQHKRKYVVVEDGASAVEEIMKNDEINLVFMDIRLSEIDGIEAMKRIKKHRKDVVVIAQTAYLLSLERDRHVYLSTGFDDFIEKPFNLDIINEIIKKY